MRFISYAAASLLVASTAACSDDLAGPPVGGVTMSVSTTVPEAGEVVRVDVRNGSGRELSYGDCFWKVEKLQDSGEWRLVQLFSCVDALWRVKPGEMFHRLLPLHERLLPGPDHRIGFTGFNRGQLPDTIVYTNRFEVRLRSESE